MALIGYGRVSKQEQHLELQLDKLRERGCSKIFTDKISGAKFEREQLNAALAYLRQGDTLVVWKLDRLGRSLRHLIDTVMECLRYSAYYPFVTPELAQKTLVPSKC